MASSFSIKSPIHIRIILKILPPIFQSDKELITLIEELGLGDRLEWLRGTTGTILTA